MLRPKKNEYAPFHATYINALPPRGNALSLLKKTFKETRELLLALPPEKADFAYEPGKWTIKQLVMHLIDAERVFALRALWFMRGDQASLPGFNQEFWMEQVDVSNRSMKDLLSEWKAVRDNTIFLHKQCTKEQEKFLGTASNFKVSVRAMFYIIVGHHLHHLEVLKEKYLD